MVMPLSKLGWSVAVADRCDNRHTYMNSLSQWCQNRKPKEERERSSLKDRATTFVSPNNDLGENAPKLSNPP